jgi:hypothetical protein
MYDSSAISKIEIVECGFDYNEEYAYQKPLVMIDDIHFFMNELSNVEFTRRIFMKALGFGHSELGIKLTYANGCYEIVSQGSCTYLYAPDPNYYDGERRHITGTFDKNEYDALLNKYFSQCKSPIFYFMNDTAEIEKIEIVDAYCVDYKEKQDKIAEVKDVTLFLEQMGNLTYRYKVKEGVSNGVLQKEEHRDAIKICYTNGDYEVIDNNWRDLYVKVLDDYVNNAYIGEFNADEFNALLKETIKNNSVSP